MGYAGPKAISKVNMIIKDKSCKLPGIKGLGNPLKFNAKLKQASADGKLSGSFKEAVDAAPVKKKHHSSGVYKKGCKKRYKK
tara:strand:- start:37 stop:282 length:246 start_codon:yes stop_codon:yes gene_type:complete